MNNDPLKQPRDAIDAIDAQIISLLGERWKLVEEVTRIKTEHNLPPLQPERFAELLNEMKRLATEQEIPTGLVEEIWNSIHKYSRRSQGELNAD